MLAPLKGLRPLLLEILDTPLNGYVSTPPQLVLTFGQWWLPVSFNASWLIVTLDRLVNRLMGLTRLKTKNITFPKLRWQAVTNSLEYIQLGETIS